MSRLEKFETETVAAAADDADDEFMKLWLFGGRLAFMWCTWCALAIPALLVLQFRG